jgi:hypothetical protein
MLDFTVALSCVCGGALILWALSLNWSRDRSIPGLPWLCLLTQDSFCRFRKHGSVFQAHILGDVYTVVADPDAFRLLQRDEITAFHLPGGAISAILRDTRHIHAPQHKSWVSHCLNDSFTSYDSHCYSYKSNCCLLAIAESEASLLTQLP